MKDPDAPFDEKSGDDEFSRLILKNYQFLSEIGIINYIDSLKEDNRNLRNVIEAGKSIANQSGILKIIEEVAKAINERFVPTTLSFILEGDRGGSEPEIVFYRNMARAEPEFSVPDLDPYRFFFNLSPMAVSFPVFEYMLGQKELSRPFEGLQAAMVVPIMGFSQVYGFIIIGEKVVGGSYSAKEVQFLESVLQFASIGLQNNIHYMKAITDFKTRLYNHAYIKTRLDMELARVKRYNQQIAVILTDVDHFKKFNDTYGHLAGDKMLMRIAEVFVETIRKGDIAGRFGGEEFVLLLAQCSKENACMVAERIRKRVEQISVRDGDRELKATISLGVRWVDAASVADADTIISQADKALYKAKESGRNKSFLFSYKPSGTAA
jgi:diguanylate cyclase (GGDEF)-like protein